jgi:asparagine synthase (glutamine-hydrolysing)
MCGIAGLFGLKCAATKIAGMVALQRHRGPDGCGFYFDPNGVAMLGHNRLSVIDLSEAGAQPMMDCTGRLHIAFNGEIYNYRELRQELRDYPYRSQTDTEVILAAYARWGEACLDRFIGMFALLIWDERERRLFAARDRFGVKPLYYHQRPDGALMVASEIRTLHAAGVAPEPDARTWADYLAHGLSDHSTRTFWKGIEALAPGHCLTWQNGCTRVRCWYDLVERAGSELDRRPVREVEEEYLALLTESVRLRFRSDVPVGINLSGGLDSSTLFGLVQLTQEGGSVKAFTYVTGDPRYDELPWVEQMLQRTRHESVICRLEPETVPQLAAAVFAHQDEPFGGLPTLAYAQLCARARAEGVIVLLDGQGMDEQWAGYDYYAADDEERLVQGTTGKSVRPDCLTDEFKWLAESLSPPQPFPDRLRNLQYRDIRYTKMPKALRFNDRASMQASVELREPFLDHRLFELALRQPIERKMQTGVRKWLLRKITKRLLPEGVVEAPKRPLQTPQREWLRGELRDWASAQIEAALTGNSWLKASSVRAAWREYCAGESDNSFYVWQWVSLGLASTERRRLLNCLAHFAPKDCVKETTCAV